jgi:hypothetical protein
LIFDLLLNGIDPIIERQVLLYYVLSGRAPERGRNKSQAASGK